MSKKKNKSTKSIVWLTLISLFIIVFGLLAFLPSFALPKVKMFGKDLGLYDFNSIYSTIDTGADFNGGTYAIFDAKLDSDTTKSDVKKSRGEALEIMRKRLSKMEIADAKAEAYGETGIKVTIPQTGTDATSIFNLICTTGKLTFITSTTLDDKEAYPELDIDITQEGEEEKTYQQIVESSKHFKSVEKAYFEDTLYLAFTFNGAGANLFETATERVSSASGTIALYFEGAEAVLTEATLSESYKETIYVSGFTESQADKILAVYKSGIMDFEIEEKQVFSYGLESKASSNQFDKFFIGYIVLLAIAIVFMIVYYRGFGVAVSLSYLLFILMTVAVLAWVPFIEAGLHTVVGLALVTVIMFMCSIYQIGKIKREYNTKNKPLDSSVKLGYKKSIFGMMDLHLLLLVAGGIMWLVGKLSTMGAILVFGSICSALVSFVFIRGFIKLFLGITTNRKFYKLNKREID